MPDTGNTVDFKVMIHKIHMGENLPSVLAGTPFDFQRPRRHDFSEVAFPQDIRNCATCHAPRRRPRRPSGTPTRAAPPAGPATTTSTGSTGANHPGGPQANDAACASCHQPVGGREWDASVQGAHTVPYKSTQLQGPERPDPLASPNAAPGQTPTVTFQLTKNDGTIVAPSSVRREPRTSLMGGPTDRLRRSNPVPRDAPTAATFDGTGRDLHVHPCDPARTPPGTWTFSIEARRTDQPRSAPGRRRPPSPRAPFNPIFYVVGRRQRRRCPVGVVVDIANCNKCHDQLALHGGQRMNTPGMRDLPQPERERRRAPAGRPGPGRSRSTSSGMIHRIHTGENLTQDYTIYGFGPGASTTSTTCSSPATAATA